MPNRSTAYPFADAGQIATPRLHPGDRITQAELQELRERADEMRLSRARLDECRARVIKKLQQNVPVEHGARRVKLVMREARYLTAKTLLPLLGKQEIERLKRHVQPTLSISLKID
jgi:hypothetical protein